MTTATSADGLPPLSLQSRMVIGAGLLSGLVLCAALLYLAAILPPPGNFIACAFFALNGVALTRFFVVPAQPWLATIQYSALRMNWILGVAIASTVIVLFLKTSPQRPLFALSLALMCLLWGAAGRRLSRRCVSRRAGP
mgnify:CR=1 FL=1